MATGTPFTCRRCGQDRWSSNPHAADRPWLCAGCCEDERHQHPDTEPNGAAE